MGRPLILCLGDSLTQTSFDGWLGGLAHTYQRRADVLNRGMSGYNTTWHKRYCQDVVFPELESVATDIVLITIFFGANDASIEQHSPHAHVPLQEYSENLQWYIDTCQSKFTNAKLLLIAPPPVHHEQRFKYQKQRYGDKATGVLERTLSNTGKYATKCEEIATTAKIPCLNLWKDMQQSSADSCMPSEWGNYFYDGLHFSKPGHDFVLHALLQLIENKLPDLSVTPCPITKQWNNSSSKCTAIPSSGPYHDHIDHTKWEEAFENKK